MENRCPYRTGGGAGTERTRNLAGKLPSRTPSSRNLAIQVHVQRCLCCVIYNRTLACYTVRKWKHSLWSPYNQAPGFWGLVNTDRLIMYVLKKKNTVWPFIFSVIPLLFWSIHIGLERTGKKYSQVPTVVFWVVGSWVLLLSPWITLCGVYKKPAASLCETVWKEAFAVMTAVLSLFVCYWQHPS